MQIRKGFAATAFTAILLSGLPAVGAAQNKDKPTRTQPNSAQNNHLDPWTRGPAGEAEFIRKIRHALLMLPYYGVFDDLGFTVEGTAVTLLGEVTRPTLKDDAGSAVKNIEGVTGVVNNIEVLPLSPNDDRIRLAAWRAIYLDNSLSARYGYRAAPAIHIIVKNGNIRLEGIVDNEMDRNIAGMRAQGVHGAFMVENDLKVDSR